jgi:hypothetical protein
MMICEFTLDAGVEIPGHAYPHEQVVMWHQERCESPLIMKASSSDRGDSYYAHSGVQHGAQVLQKAIVVDTFNPPRDDYRQG